MAQEEKRKTIKKESNVRERPTREIDLSAIHIPYVFSRKDLLVLLFLQVNLSHKTLSFIVYYLYFSVWVGTCVLSPVLILNGNYIKA